MAIFPIVDDQFEQRVPQWFFDMEHSFVKQFIDWYVWILIYVGIDT